MRLARHGAYAHSRTSAHSVCSSQRSVYANTTPSAARPPRQLAKAQSDDANTGGSADPEVAGAETELPEALRGSADSSIWKHVVIGARKIKMSAGLSINEQGLLVDEASGKVINDLGATRWDVAVSAMRGLLDPPAWVENSERTPGLILSSLKQFPLKHCFSIVGRKDATFRDDCVALIERVCQSEVEPGDVKEVERLGGKYVSLQVDVMIRAPEVIAMVLDELAKDSRVKMKY